MKYAWLLLVAGCGGDPFTMEAAHAPNDAALEAESAPDDAGLGGDELAVDAGSGADAPAEADAAQADGAHEAGQPMCGTVCDWTLYPCGSGCEPNSCIHPGATGGRCYTFEGGTNLPIFSACSACN